MSAEDGLGVLCESSAVRTSRREVQLTPIPLLRTKQSVMVGRVMRPGASLSYLKVVATALYSFPSK